MVGFEMFCERCGKRYGSGEASASGSLPLSKRLLKVVGVSTSPPPAPVEEPLLRFCLACRGYSCPECWNDNAGFCQTCVPVEEAVVEMPVAEVPVAEVPVADYPADESPALDLPAAALAFAAFDESSAEVVAEPVALEAEPESVFEAEPEVALEQEAEAAPEQEAENTFEPEPETASAPALAFAAAAGVEAIVEGPEPALAQAADDAAELTESLAMAERPIEFVIADEEEVAEAEPDIAWDWEFIAGTEAAPVEGDTPVPVFEPIDAAAAAAALSEPETPIEPPAEPAQPEVLPPPVYRPLPPLGPIMPPPPPAAAGATPYMEFDVLEPPPAFVIAPPQAQALMRPTLPAGLFDGPAPQIRPCPHCELPVSAKARFCRRCGSAQG
jgi:hypothetical protein